MQRDSVTPPASYVARHRTGELAARAALARQALADCALCPRDCHANRLETADGHCGIGRRARVSSYGPHFGEESPLVGRHGSGTIFLTSCSLHCVFCQNWDVSHERAGAEMSDEGLAAMMLELEARGCHNINLVTPTHVVAQVLSALDLAAGRGLTVPIVYNTGGYDRVETLRLLDEVVDVYMPDVKTLDPAAAARYLGAPDYPAVVRAAIREMHRQVGDLVVEDGVAVRGLLVRHLVMPGDAMATGDVMRFLAREVSRDTYLNLMDQYRPCGDACRYPAIARPLAAREFAVALDACRAEGLARLDGHVGRRFFAL